MELPKTWNLPQAIRRQFGKKSLGKQRVIFEEGHLLLVLHRAPEPHQRERLGLFFWHKPDGEWQVNERGNGIGILREHVAAYAKKEEEIDVEVDQAKDAEDFFSILERTAPLARTARNTLATLQIAHDKIPEDELLTDMIDVVYEVHRSLELHYLETKNALDFHMARQAEAQAQLGLQAVQASHRLNILAAIFFPVTALASLFGMNLVHGLESTSNITFWLVFGVGLGLGFVLRGWVVKGSWIPRGILGRSEK